MPSDPRLAVIVAALALLTPPLAAQAEAEIIPSCAAGPPITLRDAASHAMLDNADRAELLAAMLARFPMLAADRFAPPSIMLWHRVDADVDEWLYASLAPAPDNPGSLCFTATFSAEIFRQTPALTQKYFFAGAART